MRDPEAFNLIEVQVHFDARCQTVLEQIREAEMIQAIDRVRPVFNRRKIFVLNNLPLDLTVDRALTWPEMRPGNFVLAFAREGVLPLSGVDLTRCFPDLWRSEKVAEDALRWLRKTPGELQIDLLFGRIRVFCGEPLKATYRRKGQRGPLASALVRSSLPNPRAALEGMVGELVEFHMDRPSDSPAEASAPQSVAKPLQPLPPLAAVLSAEGHLLATLPCDAGPPDMLGMAGVMKLMALAAEAVGTERAAVA
jgi:hypothetical protein